MRLQHFAFVVLHKNPGSSYDVAIENEKRWPHRLARPRTPDFHSDNRGSNPLGVNNYRQEFLLLHETLAQSVEHLTFNERVDGSSPSSLNFLSRTVP